MSQNTRSSREVVVSLGASRHLIACKKRPEALAVGSAAAGEVLLREHRAVAQHNAECGADHGYACTIADEAATAGVANPTSAARSRLPGRSAHGIALHCLLKGDGLDRDPVKVRV